MMIMQYSSRQPTITIIPLPNGKRDVTVLTEEEEIQGNTGGWEASPESQSESTVMQTYYQYHGNQFRTVYELTEEEVLADLGKYLDYTTENEPTMEQLAHDNQLIDNYTMELMEGGLL